MSKPTLQYEKSHWDIGIKHIAGVDEVGRGSFAGPVVAAAVIFPEKFTAIGRIDDSKRVSPKLRLELAEIIKQNSLSYAIAEVSVEIINKIGIGKATQIAFANAIKMLKIPPDHILMDAFTISSLSPSIQTAIIHGDQISVSIAAASIIAKVYRDKLMEQMHELYKPYDFFTNKGYGTKKHRDAIGVYGLSKMHRTSFELKKYILP